MARTSIDAKDIIVDAEQSLAKAFRRIDEIALLNQKKVLQAMRNNRLTEEHFAERTGYGLNDPGREAIDKIFAEVFGTESAAVRMQFVSGTHAIACALFGNLEPGSKLVSLTGAPYDTLEEVIGIAGDTRGNGSLKSFGVQYIECNVMQEADSIAQEKLYPILSQGKALAYIQKSCGYSFDRSTLSNLEIGRLASIVKSLNPTCQVFVDNCYGEFVEANEPTEVGADLIAGSLIKNPGGGLVLAGGYIAGKEKLVEAALNRLTAPGIGGHLGLSFNQNRLILQGLFMAPSVVSNAVKGSLLFAQVLSKLGLNVRPESTQDRYDIIQAIEFGTKERLMNFCRAIQRWSPVNAHVIPEPSIMPGYRDPVVMAGGTFIEGATIELSADGPLRPPFAAFVQGGLTYLHIKCALEEALRTASTDQSFSFV
jgi:cystathionine beta-lyase family protein involved in aluminum resistance